MPAVSQRQFRAMQAAKHGRSTLGIPAKVGREFVAATGSAKGLPKRKRRLTGIQDVARRRGARSY